VHAAISFTLWMTGPHSKQLLQITEFFFNGDGLFPVLEIHLKSGEALLGVLCSRSSHDLDLVTTSLPCCTTAVGRSVEDSDRWRSRSTQLSGQRVYRFYSF
jgi:hypothetical protein